MEWLSSNWIWLALAGGAIAFFAFGRGGCGMGHGGHDHRRRSEGDRNNPPRETETSIAPFSTLTARLGSDDRAPPTTNRVQSVVLADEGVLAAENAGYDGGPSQTGHQPHRHGC